MCFHVTPSCILPPSCSQTLFSFILSMSEPFKWSSPAGHIFCCKILKESALPYQPHDYQVEGVCQSLDGINLLAITPTGSGKTGYYTMYILFILAVIKDPTLVPSAKSPKNPCLIVICPTIPLQLENTAGVLLFKT